MEFFGAVTSGNSWCFCCNVFCLANNADASYIADVFIVSAGVVMEVQSNWDVGWSAGFLWLALVVGLGLAIAQVQGLMSC
ncbi:hypothetical protein U1Q18_030728 [Sarracenia purpurea var. burkii]